MTTSPPDNAFADLERQLSQAAYSVIGADVRDNDPARLVRTRGLGHRAPLAAPGRGRTIAVNAGAMRQLRRFARDPREEPSREVLDAVFREQVRAIGRDDTERSVLPEDQLMYDGVLDAVVRQRSQEYADRTTNAHRVPGPEAQVSPSRAEEMATGLAEHVDPDTSLATWALANPRTVWSRVARSIYDKADLATTLPGPSDPAAGPQRIESALRDGFLAGYRQPRDGWREAAHAADGVVVALFQEYIAEPAAGENHLFYTVLRRQGEAARATVGADRTTWDGHASWAGHDGAERNAFPSRTDHDPMPSTVQHETGSFALNTATVVDPLKHLSRNAGAGQPSVDDLVRYKRAASILLRLNLERLAESGSRPRLTGPADAAINHGVAAALADMKVYQDEFCRQVGLDEAAPGILEIDLADHPSPEPLGTRVAAERAVTPSWASGLAAATGRDTTGVLLDLVKVDASRKLDIAAGMLLDKHQVGGDYRHHATRVVRGSFQDDLAAAWSQRAVGAGGPEAIGARAATAADALTAQMKHDLQAMADQQQVMDTALGATLTPSTQGGKATAADAAKRRGTGTRRAVDSPEP